MKKLLTLLALLIGAGANAQTLGDVLTWKKGPGLGDAKLYTTPVNSSLFSLNSSGSFALLAQSNFANASHTHPASAITDFNAVGDARWSLLAHTHVSADITDASTGGNDAADGGKVVRFRTNGDIYFSNNGTGSPSVSALSSGAGDGVSANSASGDAVHAVSITGKSIHAISSGSVSTVHANGQGSGIALEVEQNGVFGTDLALFHDGSGLGLKVKSDGGTEWTSSTGAQTTATNLPAFGTATKGVVPASGGGTTNFLRADGTWSGTVTSVSVTTANGVSGSVATATTTPAITLTLGAITPASVAASGTVGGSNLSGTNTGDQTSIVGITGSLSDFNTALTGADFATGGGTATGTNTGDQTNISGNAATVTTNANLTGPITSVGNATTVAETELAALATTTSAADKVPYFTGSGTASTADLKMGTEAAYTGTASWTCGANPTTETIRQYYTQVGNLVTWTILLTYANQGTTCTNLSLTFPTEFPTPAIPTGFTGASVRIWNVDQARFLTTPTSGTLTASGTFFIIRNAADNGFVIAPAGTYASNTVRTVTLSGIYFTQ